MSALLLLQINLSENMLCGVNRYGEGTYRAEGIKAITNAMSVSGSLKQVCPTFVYCHMFVQYLPPVVLPL